MHAPGPMLSASFSCQHWVQLYLCIEFLLLCKNSLANFHHTWWLYPLRMSEIFLATFCNMHENEFILCFSDEAQYGEHGGTVFMPESQILMKVSALVTFVISNLMNEIRVAVYFRFLSSSVSISPPHFVSFRFVSFHVCGQLVSANW